MKFTAFSAPSTYVHNFLRAELQVWPRKFCRRCLQNSWCGFQLLYPVQLLRDSLLQLVVGFFFLTLGHTETFLTLPTETNISAKPWKLCIYKNGKETGSNMIHQRIAYYSSPFFSCFLSRIKHKPQAHDNSIIFQ